MRDVREGELVLSEAPLIQYSPGQEDAFAWVEDVNAQFRSLPAAKQEAAMALADSFQQPGRPKSIIGVLRTNSFMRGMGSKDGALCETAARFNHSCSPNCEHSWDKDAGEMQIYASTNIPCGEELTIFYVDPRGNKVQRGMQFKGFGFACCCPVCRVNDNVGDARRLRMQEIVQTTGEVSKKDPKLARELVIEALHLYEQEGIHANTFRKGACRFASMVSNQLGDKAAAVDWADKAAAYSSLCHGPEHRETRQLREFAAGLAGGAAPA